MNTEYRYTPGELEAEALDRLYDYLEEYIKSHSETPLLTEFVRVWMHAAASSPYALSALALTRQAHLDRAGATPTANELAAIQQATDPRQEPTRLERLCAWAPPLLEENELSRADGPLRRRLSYAGKLSRNSKQVICCCSMSRQKR